MGSVNEQVPDPKRIARARRPLPASSGLHPDFSSPPRVTTPALVSAASATVCTMPSAARQPKLLDRLRKDLCARHYGNRIYKADGR